MCAWAWTWAVAHDPAHGLPPMLDTLFEFYEVRALVQEAADRFGQALTTLQRGDQTVPQVAQTRLKLLNRQARFLARLGRWPEAESLLQASLRVSPNPGRHE